MHMYMYGTEFMHMQKCKSSSHYVPAKLGMGVVNRKGIAQLSSWLLYTPYSFGSSRV